MAESSLGGALVPSVKSEGKSAGMMASESQTAMSEDAGGERVAASSGGGGGGGVELDKDFLCPICMQVIKDAFLTSCGHSFCYMCIVTHLRNKNDCPCCGQYLTINHLYPNFLLDKVGAFRCFDSLIVCACIAVASYVFLNGIVLLGSDDIFFDSPALEPMQAMCL